MTDTVSVSNACILHSGATSRGPGYSILTIRCVAPLVVLINAHGSRPRIFAGCQNLRHFVETSHNRKMKLYTDVGNCQTLKILVAAAESGNDQLEVVRVKPGGKPSGRATRFMRLIAPIIALNLGIG